MDLIVVDVKVRVVEIWVVELGKGCGVVVAVVV